MKFIVILFVALGSVGWTFWNSAVTATFETEPVASDEDAADDTAVWVHPRDPARSLIVATDKKAGLLFYSLSGRKLAEFPVGRINNIDVREGFDLQGRSIQLIAGSNRTTKSLDLWTIAAESLRLIPLGRFPLSDEPYGLCMGRLGATPEISVFIPQKSGVVEHWLVGGGSTVSARRAPPLRFSSQSEGCVVDDLNRRLYVGEEDVGLWMVDFARRSAPVLVDRVAPHGRLAADVEGLAIYRNAGTNGFLVVSSQGDHSFHVYDLLDGVHRGRFVIAPGAIDGVTDTDGIEIVSAGLHPQLPAGFLIAQDGTNEEPGGRLARQNFKIVDWRQIRAALRLDIERHPVRPR